MKENQEDSLVQYQPIINQQDPGHQKNEGINYSPDAIEVDNEVEKTADYEINRHTIEKITDEKPFWETDGKPTEESEEDNIF